MWDEFYHKLTIILDKVPISKTKITKDGNVKTKSPWERSSLITARKSKDHHWAIFDEHPTSKNLNIALEKQNEFEKKMTKCMVGYEHKLCNNLKHNPKPFYSYLKSKRKIKNSLAGLRDKEGNTLNSAEEVANELGSFFESTYIKEPSGGIPELEKRTDTIVPDLEFQTSDVKLLLEKLNVSKSFGPDELHPKLLKNLCEVPSFVESLTKLFNLLIPLILDTQIHYLTCPFL